jgi:hypothetical protein
MADYGPSGTIKSTLPAVEPGIPARRNGRSADYHARSFEGWSGRKDATLYGRQDARRYDIRRKLTLPLTTAALHTAVRVTYHCRIR